MNNNNRGMSWEAEDDIGMDGEPQTEDSTDISDSGEKGGEASSGQFQEGSERAREAGRIGGMKSRGGGRPRSS